MDDKIFFFFFKNLYVTKRSNNPPKTQRFCQFFPGQYITFHVLFAARVDERNEDNHTGVDRIYHLESR